MSPRRPLSMIPRSSGSQPPREPPAHRPQKRGRAKILRPGWLFAPAIRIFARPRFCSAPPPAALAVARPRPPCVSTCGLGRGQTWRRVRGWCFALLEGRAESEDKPPAPSALPPRFGGLLGEDLGAEVRVGTFMKLIADLEASWRKTPTLKKPRERPTPGGSAEGTGGLSHALLDPQQAPCEPKTAQPTPGLPPSRDRRSRYRGAADDRQGGPRGVRA